MLGHRKLGDAAKKMGTKQQQKKPKRTERKQNKTNTHKKKQDKDKQVLVAHHLKLKNIYVGKLKGRIISFCKSKYII